MRWRLLTWYLLSLLCLVGAWWFWGLGERWAGRGQRISGVVAPGGATDRTAGGATRMASGSVAGTRSESSLPGFMLMSAGAPAGQRSTLNSGLFPSSLAYRLNNTGKRVGELVREERVILLENAMIDTRRPLGFGIPEHLRAAAESGSYIVQARGGVDESFRAALRGAGAEVVSYIPNHAFLVRVLGAGAGVLRGHPRVQAVLVYEPYYKLKGTLLGLGVRQEALPEGARLKVLGFADGQGETRAALEELDAEVLAEERSPFGPVWTVRAAGEGWTELARLDGVQAVEWQRERVGANDLSRVRLGVATNTLTRTNYLGLTGSNVIVNVNDTGVSTNHPDLAGRVWFDVPLSGVDSNGHGTHVAGIIAGSGLSSTNPVNVGEVAQGSVTNADFRGQAPGARIFSMASGLGGPVPSDAYLQERAARTNALISNNSWHYGGDNTYGIGAASYDAAVRDALPGEPGSQPLVLVFAAGNGAGGDDSGLSGDPETILSPGTAKNVITVGATEQPRDITNAVWKCTPCAACTNGVSCVTNTPWRATTSSASQVAGFSGRGNVGIGIEGDWGRFKPDVVAPGTFVISTRSLEWDERAYYNPTNHHVNTFRDQLVLTNALNNYNVFVPANAVAVFINVVANQDSPSPFPDVPIFVRQADIPTTNTYDFVVTNSVAIPPDHGGPSLTPVGVPWFYSVGNVTTQNLSLDIVTDIVTTNDLGNYYEVLSNLNHTLGPYYRYESGTSLAAAAASGTLALLQEFFETRLRVTNSPALYKALLINGARSVGTLYDFQVRNTINYQGWGLIQLPNSLPESLTNGVRQAGPAAMQLFDQSPTNALATGERQTRQVRLSEDALGLGLPLRVTLVWTDPPGNPVAGVKLVNDLDLVVTNLDTGEVFLGNDIGPSSNFTFPWNTNTVPNADAINNVENVYLLPPLGTNYAVTVIGRHVNVNAVTAHTNNVAQDYALVISYGNGEVADALEVTPGPVVGQNEWTLTGITNDFQGGTVSGQLLLGQHVGANPPLLGVTNGVINQWHFYVITNTTDYTNAAFVTFLPPTLSLPRLGVREEDVNNATRREADIDLYVSQNAGLTNLVAAVIAGADQSRGRGGTELIVYSNSVRGDVYYIGVKAEDQMAAEYAFLAVFSLEPFSTRDGNGNLVVPGIPIPATVPDGSPADPGVALMLGLAVEPVPLRRVVVLTNAYFHENPGDLLGVLSHGERFAVLNNHRGGLLGQYAYVYEDNGEGDLPGALRTDGPGSLRDFVGEEGLGVWVLAMTDNSLSATGEVRALRLLLEPQNVDSNATVRTVPPNTFTFDFVDVPIAATNLTVCVASNTEPVELYLRRGDFPSRTVYDYTATIPAGGGCLSVDKSDLPPLTSGRYYLGVFNPSAATQTILLTATVLLDPSLIVPITFDSAGNEPLRDDVVDYSSIFVTDRARIAQVEVGLRVDHPRISDLAFTLISPGGTRVLLMENRGNTNRISAGSSVVTTNVTVEETSFETVLAGTYTPGFPVEGWLVTSNLVTVVQNPALAHTGAKVLSLREGGIERSYATVPGADCTLTYAYRRVPTLEGIVSWWPGENNANDVADGNDGTLVGNVSYVPGVVAQAFVFDGDRDGILIGNAPNLQLQDFSIEAWVKRANASVPSFNGNNNGTLFALGTGSLGGPAGYNFYIKANSQLAFGKSQAGEVTSGASITDTNWHHVAVTKTGAAVVFYVDGTAYPASSPYNLGPFTFGAPGYIGAWQNPSGQVDNSFYGVIDELAVFDRALSAAEIQAIYAAGTLGMGKCDLTAPPAHCLSFTAQVAVGALSNTFTALSTNWVTNSINFVATQTNTVASFNALGGHSGLWLDTISLRQTIVLTQNFYLTFTEDTNRTSTPIKFAPPPFSTASTPTNFLLSGFEPVSPGAYAAPALVDGWDVLTSNEVLVISDLRLANTGTNSLSLSRGQIHRLLPTTAGRNYRLDFAYRSDVAFINLDFGSQVFGTPSPKMGRAATGRTATDFWNFYNRDDAQGNWRVNGAVTNLSLANGTATAIGLTALNVQGAWGNGSLDVMYNGYVYPLPNGPGLVTVIVTNLPVGLYDFYLYSHNGDYQVVSGGVDYGRRTSSDGNTTGTVPVWQEGVQYAQFRSVAVTNRAEAVTITARPRTDVAMIAGLQIVAFETSPALMETPVARAFIPGLTNTFTGGTNWLTNSLAFTAAQNGTPLGLAPQPGGQSGVLLDTFTLTEYPSSIYYLPEESLNALLNENVFGLWRLEVLDTRTGASNLASLVSWQLQFIYQTDIPLPGVLTHGEPRTNTIPAGQTAYYIVDVPAWAQWATNTLLFASGPVNVLFNQNLPPSPQLTNAGDFLLLGPNATGGSATLDAISTPILLPGQRYYLGVHNPGATPVTYAVQVEFDITPLFNGVPVTSTLNLGALPRYFYYDVSTNATAVSFQLTNLSGNVDLVARQGTPLPTFNDYDYGSFNPGPQDEGLFIFTNSSPVALLTPGRWYLGVFNLDVVPVAYTIVANEYTNLAPFITLTNGIPYDHLNTGVGVPTDYYRYVVTGNVARAQFEINNPSADLTLVARKGLPLPDLGLFDYLSANPPPNDELIVLFTNSAPVALTTGDWFLTAVNVSGGPASYAIKATQWPEPGRPVIISDASLQTNRFCLSWASLVGVHYYVQGLTNLSTTTNYWETISPTLTATDVVTTWCIPLPTPYQFFRVVEGLALNVVIPPPVITSIVHTNNTVELRWDGPTYASYQVQWTPTLIPPNWTTFTNVVTSTTGQFLFVDDGTQTAGLTATRYYRLRLMP